MLNTLYLKLIGLGLVVVLVLSGVWYVRHLQTEVGALKADKAELSAKIQLQNAAVEKLKTDADARVAAGEVKVAAAETAASAARGRATIIYKSKPSTPNDLCKSALDLLNTK